MENDSPNLFDSETMSVKLTVADNHDDILAEIIEEVHQNGKPLSSAESNKETERINEQNVIDFHTDESDDEEVVDDLNQSTECDKLVDQSSEHQKDDSPMTKAKDVHKGLPPGRVKLIMKMDPDVNIIAGDAVFLVTKATVKHYIVVIIMSQLFGSLLSFLFRTSYFIVYIYLITQYLPKLY